MANELLKTIKIAVDSSEYKALEKSLKTISKLEADINKLNNDNEDIYKLRKKILEEEIVRLKNKKNLTESEKKLTEAGLKLKQKEVEKELKLLDINKKLIKVKQQAANEEKRLKAKELREGIGKNADQRARELQREKWARGSESLYTTRQRYKGIGGYFTRLSDEAEKAGEEKVAGIEGDIGTLEDTKKANQAQIEYLESIGKKGSSGELDKRSKEYKEIERLKAENKGIDTKIEQKKDEKAQAIGETKTQMGKYQAMGQAAQKVAGQLNKVAGILLTPFKQLKNAVVDVVKQMLDLKTGVATFNTATSLITNASAREQQMKYGLTSSQNYGFTQAKSLLNIQSDEDLMYMNSEQRDRFLGYMEKYSAWYDKMDSSGVLQNIQEMQLEFQELKQELAMEFLQWVAENKETIMACIKGIFAFIKTIANIVMGIIKILSFGFYKGESNAEESDAYESNTTNNNQRSTVINVNANTTNNATGILSSQEALDAYNKENFNKLAKQIATAIGG